MPERFALAENYHKVFCPGECFQISIRENFGLKEDGGIAEQQIPTIFNVETELLSEDNMSNLNRHYMSCYCKVRKDFLDFLKIQRHVTL
jgi:hypothetical protein